jgi:hypothetical protein
MTAHIIQAPVEIAPGLAYGICAPIRLDGRTSTYPVDIDGWSTVNCLLVLDDGYGLLLDSGVPAHEDQVVGQVADVLGDRRLAVAPLRFGEFGGGGNVRALAERLPVHTLYGRQVGEPDQVLEFRPEVFDGDGPSQALSALNVENLPTNGTIEVIPGSARRLVRTMTAPIKLLSWPWAYDARSRTLFTSEMFNWGVRDDEAGPWTLTVDDDPIDEDLAWTVLVHGRYWWLPGAHAPGIERLRSNIREVFDTYAVDAIVPGAGAVIHGRAAVERHVALLDTLLCRAGDEDPIGVEAGAWPSRREAR